MKIVKLQDIPGMTFPTGRTTRVLSGQNVLSTKQFTCGYVTMEPQGKVPRHAHSNEEVYIIVGGIGRMQVGDEEEWIEAVSAVYIPPNLPHSLQNTGKEELTMIFVYAPAGIVDHWSEEMQGKMK